jgi:hypothetical protein
MVVSGVSSPDECFMVIGKSFAYFNAGCEACTAQPPVPDVPQVWLLKVEKYTWEAPTRVSTVLS